MGMIFRILLASISMHFISGNYKSFLYNDNQIVLALFDIMILRGKDNFL